jgi:hypothetical protein
MPFSWQFNDTISRPDLFRFQWDFSPAVSTSCYLNFANRTQFSVNSSCLRESQTYEVSVRLIYNITGGVLSTQKLLFTIPRRPFGGRLACTPVSGKAFETRFNCTASGWIAVDNVVRYQFFTRDDSTGQ